MNALTVPCAAPGVRVAASGQVTHLCPHVDETDHGTVTVTWTTAGATIELHALADHLRGHKDRKTSHEDLAADLRATLAIQPGITDVTVTAEFTTAGLDVTVRAGGR